MASQEEQTPPPQTDPSKTFVPPSINHETLLSGSSYTYYSHLPEPVLTQPCLLGVDEAGRGPVLGPMVYAVYFLPIPLSTPLLREAHPFDDSKVLSPAVRSSLMRTLCEPDSDLHSSSGWAISALSARDISAGMFRPTPYNLNAQAMDATVELIRGVMERGVDVREIYVDTIGSPAVYEAKLQRLFPTANVTVAKKADSLYPCVSAASVCAKVTRDAALEALYAARAPANTDATGDDEEKPMAWGSGYPSDARCVSWLRSNMHPVFGWGPECRFSWGTAKDLVEGPLGAKVEWPVDDDANTVRMTDFFTSGKEGDELGTWFGSPVGVDAF